jgi:DNA-binding LacI/PurR family transcriptional regulator/serine phosphatase RsbU (regulator of sigma subunit)
MLTRQIPTIALLMDYLVSSYQLALLRAVERACRTREVSLLTLAGRSLQAPSIGDRTQNRVYDLLGPDNVDGILLVSGCMSYSGGPVALAEYCRRYQPLPVCSIGVELPNTPSLVVSNEQGTRAAVEHLIVRHGARRIAYIAGPEPNSEAQERYRGYLAALGRHGLEPNDALVTRGDFSIPTGVTAMRELLARGVAFDAIVAANDYMAIAALDVLREHGLRVPQDVLLAGFDDAPFARFALPSLTTVRQPLERLARSAVDLLLEAMAGGELPRTTEIEVDLVARQSCGCGLYPAKRFDSEPPSSTLLDTAECLMRNREELTEALHAHVGVPPDALGGWATRLLDALHADLSGNHGRFLAELNLVLELAQPHPDFVDELVKVVGLLRVEVLRCRPQCEVALDLEQMWHLAQLAVGNAAINAQGREKLELQVVVDAIRVGFERIGTALSLPTLRQAVAGMLPDVQIKRAMIGLSEEESPEVLVPFLTVVGGSGSGPPPLHYPATQLVPRGFFPDVRHSHIVLPLSFEEDWFGLFVMEYTTNETVYGLLRDHVSSALKGGALHRAALRQTALLERLEREQLEQEAKIAARIQTAILPGKTPVEGLAISAELWPAADVGGDYYDIIPFEGGCWIGIGDVTGHGLLAGLVMLMIQGMVAAMVKRDAAARPSQLVTALNSALHENLRHRLGLDDFATLTLLRYERNGCVTFSGAHEELVVYRARTRRCETIASPGVWVGPLPDVSQITTDGTLTLEDGDLLVLYTDGVIEAMNEYQQQFGMDRLLRLIESRASGDVEELSRAIVAAAGQWQARQVDDVTVLVARYTAERSRTVADGVE